MSLNLSPQLQIMNQLARIANQLHRSAGGCPISSPGLSPSQVSTLAYLFLRQDQDVYQKDVESIFNLCRSTVSSMLNTLEKKALIQRVSVPHDARLKKLLLTQEGYQLSREFGRVFDRMDALLTKNLSQEEILTLQTILTKIETNLSQEVSP